MLRSVCVLALVLVACDGPSEDPDASVPDGAGRDAGRLIDDAGRDGGSVSDAGSDAGMVDAGPATCEGPPGLYVGGADCSELEAGVRPFHPRYALWSDDADKERFIYLPPGTQIDTTLPDRWEFPMGTRLYKTFALDGVRLETRILEKVAPESDPSSWRMVSYRWSVDQLSVEEVGAFGELDVLGTDHDIPTQRDCVRCHSEAQDDAIMGFSAIQLNHDEGGVTLATLRDEGWLSSPIALADAQIPGDAVAQAALGYLHANCGNCHGGAEPEHGLDYWINIGTTDLTATPTWAAICDCSVWSGSTPGGEVVNLRISPGRPDLSVSLHRMLTREPTDMMPPIGSEIVDDEGVRVVSEWISSLDPSTNGCPHGCPFP